MSTTANYGFTLQDDKSQNFSMDKLNENMDKIDEILSSHELDTSNPHTVTKEQVGLGNVANVDTTTTANITDSENKRFVNDIQRTLLNNTSKSIIGELSASILSTEWTGTGPFEKMLSVAISGEQITSTTHEIKITPVWSGTIAQKKAAMEAYSYISEGVITSNNVFTLTCYDYKPETGLTLNLEVWRKWL